MTLIRFNLVANVAAVALALPAIAPGAPAPIALDQHSDTAGVWRHLQDVPG